MKAAGKVFLLSTALLGLSNPAFANVIWAGGPGNWIDPSAWVGGVVPISTDHAVINTGEAILSGSVTLDGLTLGDGIIKGTGSITTNTLNWTKGNINFASGAPGVGIITVNGDAVLGAFGTTVSVVDYEGPYWDCVGCSTSRIILNGNTTLKGQLIASTGDIVNNGTLTLKEGSTTHTPYLMRYWSPLINNGTIIGDAGAGKVAGLLNHDLNSSRLEVATGTLEIYNIGFQTRNSSTGVIQVNSGATLSVVGDWGQEFFNDGGQLVIESGAKLQSGSFVQNSGSTTIKNAALETTDDPGIAINGGNFTASGQLKGGVYVNGGNFSLGDTPAALTIQGDLLLGADSNFLINIGGTDQGLNYDWVQATGNIHANGSLDVDFSFDPVNGNTFTLFSGSILADQNSEYGAGYSFSQVNVNGLDLSKYSYQLNYAATSISLIVQAVPEPSTSAMLGLGMGLLAFVARRKRS
ncbi:PEP-CTERM sorting domain-containing protein [Methylobacillus glycogenes]|uniref:PEP-CTERM sorting domain-containing protein n=1 Tax=Methylobacillus glycogenes TaxID=406 RepID=UPI0011DE2636|nr:PEP-CTERM sorting domain-containing protein [Methylobacillus glycogenes]